MSIYRILVVEDQLVGIEAIIDAIVNVVPDFFPKYSVSFARWYQMAKELISEESYGLIFLDHRMPNEDPGCGEDDERCKYAVRDLGYNLIPIIREKLPEALIIGTSSMRSDEFSKLPAPDFRIQKAWKEARTSLRELLMEAGRK
ncbi:MAG: hypothetical protein WA064_05485 [Candidatus Moraniibacteriota bacterium]